MRTKDINFLTLPHDVDFSAVWTMLQEEKYAILVEKNQGQAVRHWIVTADDLLKYFNEN